MQTQADTRRISYLLDWRALPGENQVKSGAGAPTIAAWSTIGQVASRRLTFIPSTLNQRQTNYITEDSIKVSGGMPDSGAP